jgi:hypothetical protein
LQLREKRYLELANVGRSNENRWFTKLNWSNTTGIEKITESGGNSLVRREHVGLAGTRWSGWNSLVRLEPVGPAGTRWSGWNSLVRRELVCPAGTRFFSDVYLQSNRFFFSPSVYRERKKKRESVSQ